MYPNVIKNAIDALKLFPGIGEKTAERLALSLIDMDDDDVEFLSSSLLSLKTKIKNCEKCNVLSDQNICSICSNKLRENNILCVVEDSRSVFLFEKNGVFNGKYFVLNGLISPLDGINPEDIGIDRLLRYIETETFNEIIFAFKPSVEGETTALYIKRILDGFNLKITRLASGIPVGADLEYLDVMTLERALSDRKDIE